MSPELISIITFVVEKYTVRYDLNENRSEWLVVRSEWTLRDNICIFCLYFFKDHRSVWGVVDTQLNDVSIDMSCEYDGARSGSEWPEACFTNTL